jgi:hypothetical protein
MAIEAAQTSSQKEPLDGVPTPAPDQSQGQPRSDIADQFKAWSEAAFNIAKIVAIVAVGGWTLFQWNRVIFPKESADDFARRVATRTDLEINADDINFRILDNSSDVDDDNATDGKARPSQLLYVFGELEVANQKSFPIELAVERFELRFGKLRTPADVPPATTPSTVKPMQVVSVDWQDFHQIDGGQADQKKPENPVLETNGRAGIPVSLVFSLPPDEVKLLPVELQFLATATAVDPVSGKPVITTKKQKVYNISALLDTTNADDPVVRGADVETKRGSGFSRHYHHRPQAR